LKRPTFPDGSLLRADLDTFGNTKAPKETERLKTDPPQIQPYAKLCTYGHSDNSRTSRCRVISQIALYGPSLGLITIFSFFQATRECYRKATCEVSKSVSDKDIAMRKRNAAAVCVLAISFLNPPLILAESVKSTVAKQNQAARDCSLSVRADDSHFRNRFQTHKPRCGSRPPLLLEICHKRLK